MLRIILTLGFIFQITSLFSQRIKDHYSYKFSDYYDEGTKTWEPSQCDCDYESGDLMLNPDSTFSLKLQEGRLDAKISRFYGQWYVEKDSVLHLLIKEEEIEISDKNASFTRFLKIPYGGYHYHRVYYVSNSGLYDDYRLWK